MIVQVSKICTPNETVCSTKIRKNSFGCRVSCTGLNADVSYSKGNPEDTTMDEEDKILDIEVFSKLTKDYKDFKSKFVRNIIFNSTSPSLGAHFRYIPFLLQTFMFCLYSPVHFQPQRKKMRSTSLRSSLTPQPMTRLNRTRR